MEQSKFNTASILSLLHLDSKSLGSDKWNCYEALRLNSYDHMQEN